MDIGRMAGTRPVEVAGATGMAALLGMG